MPASPCMGTPDNPSCGELASYKGRCPDCAREWNAQTHRTGRLEPKSGRMYGKKRWLMLRRRRLFLNPLCAQCGELASDVHHVQAVEDGGDPWALENTEALCHPCHSRVTRREQLGVSSGRDS